MYTANFLDWNTTSFQELQTHITVKMAQKSEKEIICIELAAYVHSCLVAHNTHSDVSCTASRF